MELKPLHYTTIQTSDNNLSTEHENIRLNAEHSAPEAVQQKKNVTQGWSMVSTPKIYVELKKLKLKIFALHPKEISNFWNFF